jgi:hypothetical protein
MLVATPFATANEQSYANSCRAADQTTGCGGRIRYLVDASFLPPAQKQQRQSTQKTSLPLVLATAGASLTNTDSN